MKHIYNWKPQLPDKRDKSFKLLRGVDPIMAALPPSVDLSVSPFMPPIWNQGDIGSCTAHGIGAAFEYTRRKEGLDDFMPSRLFIYWNERAMEGTTDYDAGANIRDGIKSLNSEGVCHEDLWPYLSSALTFKPSDTAFAAALQDLAVEYQFVDQDLTSLKRVLAAGLPVVFGFTVYESFESDEVAQTGIVPMPAPTERVLGGHCVLCVGYDDATQTFLVRNSWDATWAINGYCKMPYGYLTDENLASDFWVLQKVI